MPVMILMEGLTRSGVLGMTLRILRSIPTGCGGRFIPSGTAFEMNTDPAMVALVVCATQSVGAHILGLPNLSGDIDKYAGEVGGLTVVC